MSSPYKEEELGKHMDFGFLPKLWPFVRPYKRAFGLCLVLLLVSFGIDLLGPYLVNLAISGPLSTAPLPDGVAQAEPGQRMQTLLWLLCGYLATVVIGGLVSSTLLTLSPRFTFSATSAGGSSRRKPSTSDLNAA